MDQTKFPVRKSSPHLPFLCIFWSYSLVNEDRSVPRASAPPLWNLNALCNSVGQMPVHWPERGIKACCSWITFCWGISLTYTQPMNLLIIRSQRKEVCTDGYGGKMQKTEKQKQKTQIFSGQDLIPRNLRTEKINVFGLSGSDHLR